MIPDYICDYIHLNNTKYTQRPLNKFKLQTKLLINLSSQQLKLFLYMLLSHGISSPLPYVLFHRLLFLKLNLKHSYLLILTTRIYKQARKSILHTPPGYGLHTFVGGHGKSVEQPPESAWKSSVPGLTSFTPNPGYLARGYHPVFILCCVSGR